MRLLFRVATSLLVTVVVIYAGIFLWTKVIHPAEDKLNSDDLTAVVTDTSPEATDPALASDVSGIWKATTKSTLGYRVKEVLGGLDTEAVGRTDQVTGELVIEASRLMAATFSVNVGTITSDSSKRDNQFTGNIMDVSTYPTADFVLTTPIDFGSIPLPGVQLTAIATGDLTLHGVTRAVTFEVTTEYASNVIGVLGSIDITFADYGIANPSNAFVSTGDTGLLEFVLAFER
jgi:polyisoprenoid-binding protein YceI